MKNITSSLIKYVHSEVEKKYGRRFIYWGDSWSYKLIGKYVLRRIGMKKRVDEFIKSRSITLPWCVMIPYQIGSSEQYISLKRQLHICTEETQHVIDSSSNKRRWYRRYISDPVFRAVAEGRGSLAANQVSYHTGNAYTSNRMLGIYLPNSVAKSTYKTIMNSCKLKDGPSFESSKFICELIGIR